MSWVNPEHAADARLIERWEALPKGCRWTAAHYRVHDELAVRVALRGRIRHGHYLYLPTDDDSFERVPIRQGSAPYVNEGRIGRAAEIITPDLMSQIGRIGFGRSA